MNDLCLACGKPITRRYRSDKIYCNDPTCRRKRAYERQKKSLQSRGLVHGASGTKPLKGTKPRGAKTT